MGQAAYVGRVGALAVALGVGFAVATTPGVAWADGGDTGSDTTNPRGAGTTSGTEHDATPLADTRSDGTAAAHPGIASTVARAFGFPTTTGQRVHRFGRPAYTQPQAANGTDEVKAYSTALTQTTPRPPAHETTSTDLPAIVPMAIAHRLTRITPTPAALIGAPSTTRPSALANTPAATLAIADTAPARPVITTPVTLPAPRPASLVTALPAAFLSVASSLLNAVLSPAALPGGPAAPIDPPQLWAVLAFVRRQFVNTTPTLHPTPTHTDPTTGLVSGNLGGADADGDPITYRVESDPAHGAVSIDQTTGAYVYTPRDGYSGADTFVVSVTDTGPDGLFGFLRPGRGHTSAASLTITVDPRVTVTVDPVTDPAGAAEVTGRVETTDPNPHTYNVSTPPSRGEVVVHADGTFTYTPNPVDRVRANATTTLDDDVDAFAVTIDDGINPPTSVVVTVPLSPTASAQAYRMPAGEAAVGGIVVDPTAHVAYQTTEGFDTSTGKSITHVAIITENGSDKTVGVIGQRPAGGVVVDPTTHIAYLTTYGKNVDNSYTTTVSAITPNSIATVANLPGQAAGGVVLDPTTHTAYQLTQSHDADGNPTSEVTAISLAGTAAPAVVASRLGDPGGTLVLDPTTHTTYLTTNVWDSATGTYTATQVTAITSAGTTTVADIPGEHPVGEVVLNPITHTVYLTTEFQNPITGANGIHVTAISSDGTTTIAATLRGRADRGVVIDPATGTVYQTSFSQNGDGTYTTTVSPIPAAGTTVPNLDGTPVGTLVLDPATHVAYQTTQFQNSVTGVPGVHVTAIAPDGTATIVARLRGRPEGGAVLDPTTGTVYQTTVENDSAQVSVITASGTTVIPVPGDPVGGVVIDPATGTVYQTTTAGVYVVGAAPVTPPIAV